jgi:RHS repeat-associated protein
LQRVSTRKWNPQYQITDYTANLGQVWQSEWNDERQLLSARDPQCGKWRFRYDESGHLHQLNLDGHVISDFERDRLHREVLRTQGQITTRSEYDRSGRLRARQRRHAGQPSLMPAAAQKHFEYDAEHRLIQVRSQKGERETVVNMTYDPLGRRITKTEHDSRGYALGETRFTWDGLRLLQEHRHSQTSLYLYEDDGYTPLARIDGVGEHQSVRYYHNDLNGLPEQLTEADGHNVWRATYRVWGNALEEVREAYFIEEQNLRFQGQYLDRETGLHYNTFRFYDPDIGRFTTPDPIGLAGGLNLYQYAPNPFGWVDPKGLACSTYKGKLNQKASQMHALTKGSKEWKQAVADSKIAMANGGKFQVKVKSSSDAKFFLKESQGNMNRYKAHTQSARADGVAKYPKGYEQHMAPEGGFGDTPHIKWYKNGGDGHIFYDIPN